MTLIYKGNIIFTKEPEHFTILEKGYIVVTENKIQGVYETLPEKYNAFSVVDFGNKLIIPGLIDMHCHAAQYKNAGIGMDEELLPWLFKYTFPEESHFKNIDYAKKIYERFIKDIWINGTTRAVIYGSLHKEATTLLMEMLIKAGIGAYVGKVNMDMNNIPDLSETCQQSLDSTESILRKYSTISKLVKPIITPRFIPSCSAELLRGLKELSEKYNIPVQSHLSENQEEVALVKELYPKSKFYGDVYDSFGLFGPPTTLMAHCIYCTDEEVNLIYKNGVTIVHCPTSNFNLGSGIMPARKYLDKGINLCVGSDISGGQTLSMFKVMSSAIEASKILWVQSKKKYRFLSTSEAFYMATKAASCLFKNVGSFEEGYEFDALVIDDNNLYGEEYTIEQRLDRLIYMGDHRNIVKRFIAGIEIPEPYFKS